MSIYIYVYIYIQLHTYIYICIQLSIYIYIYAHTSQFRLVLRLYFHWHQPLSKRQEMEPSFCAVVYAFHNGRLCGAGVKLAVKTHVVKQLATSLVDMSG